MMNPFSSRCCQHNHSMGWPYFTKHLWLATPDHGLCAVLQDSPARSEQPVEKVTLVPMGAARLRISAFPTIATDASAHYGSP